MAAPGHAHADMAATPVDTVLAYHRDSAHGQDRYAPGPETLDWDEQPDPFRRFDGATHQALPLAVPTPRVAWPGMPGPDVHPLYVDGLALLLRHGFGLSALKAFGPDRWSLRCNPSSGNLHPSEVYVMCRGVEGLASGVHHYRPDAHGLELRCAYADGDSEPAELRIGLSTIAWREAWKYGLRAFRYLQLDTGHALGALAWSAALPGWRLELLPWSDDEIGDSLGLGRSADIANSEAEWPEVVVRVSAGNPDVQPGPGPWIGAALRGRWHGSASPVGGRPRLQWLGIERVAEATRQSAGDPPPYWMLRAEQNDQKRSNQEPGNQEPGNQKPGKQMPIDHEPIAPRPRADQSPPDLATLILRRRSAQAFNARASLPLRSFRNLLAQTLPGSDNPAWRTWSCSPHLHLVLFVHRVQGLEPGVYALPRTPDALTELRDGMLSEFDWTAPWEIGSGEIGSGEIVSEEIGSGEICPLEILPGLPLSRLAVTDSRKAARALSCRQDIAASGAFSLSMVARLAPGLDAYGPAAYRHLHWEAGLIGQCLYLAAEAEGVRGTGIGCFLDPAVGETLGFKSGGFEPLYHFTVGTPKADARIQTDPAYAERMEAEMAGFKGRIADTWKRREALKADLDAGRIPPRKGLADLEEVDVELSRLDSAFKALWDTLNAERRTT